MFESGLIDEVTTLRKNGYDVGLNALNTFGYREVFQLLDGKLTQDEALAELQQGTRRYAKRQMTWFRGEQRLQWIEGEEKDPAQAILDHLKSP